MNEEEKRMKVIKHNAKRQGYFIKMIISLIMIFVFIYLEPKSDLMFVLCFVMMLICGMAAMCYPWEGQWPSSATKSPKSA